MKFEGFSPFINLYNFSEFDKQREIEIVAEYNSRKEEPSVSFAFTEYSS